MARNEYYATVVRREGFSQGLLDILGENGPDLIEERAEKAFYRMGFRTYLREFIAGYKEGRAAFDKAGNALIANPYDRAERAM
jgi:hypothetical protein